MKVYLRWLMRLGLVCCWAGALGVSVAQAKAQLSQAAGSADASAQLCLPNAKGDGWNCQADQGQAVAIEVQVPIKGGPAVVVEPATQLELSADPALLYRPTPARPVASSHRLTPGLAARLYMPEATSDKSAVCAGQYVVREYPHPRSSNSSDFVLEASADQLTAEVDVRALLSGNVTLEQGNRRVVSPNADVDYDNRVVRFVEGARLDEPGLVIQGQSATIHLDSNRVELNDAEFVLTDANLRGEADALVQGTDGNLLLTQNEFTRCVPGNSGWELSAKRLEIEKDAVFGTARHAVLRLKSVPVFYTPYLKFPVSDDRVSGFLFPDLGYSGDDGVEISLPYYLNLAPNYDATVTPIYVGKRGAGGEVEFRQRSVWQATTLGGAYLPKDNLYNGWIDRSDFDDINGESVFGPFKPADRWLGRVDHRGQFGAFRTRIDFTSVSDRDYFRDLGTDLALSSQRALERRGEVQFNRGNLSMRLWAQRFQRLDRVTVEDYQRLPELDLLYRRALRGPFSLSLGAKWSEFDRDTQGLVGLAALTGSRTHVEPRLHMRMDRSWGFVNATGGYRHTAYDLSLNQAGLGGAELDSSPDRGIGLANLDAGLFFEREVNWLGRDVVQTLEPRVYYLWQAYEDQSDLPRFDASQLTFSYSQLYRDNRFAGLDRVGDADQISTGLTTRFLSPSSGVEYARLSVGQIFYFDDRRVTLFGPPGGTDARNTSAIVAEASAALAGHWRLTGNVIWDRQSDQVDEGGFGLQYRRDNRHIINLGFRNRRRSDIEQSDLSWYWPVTRTLGVFGRWNYDLVSGRTIEAFGGLEYGDCCLQVRFMARRFLDSPTANEFDQVDADKGVFLQIMFKGLAGFGATVDSIFERGISGYRGPE